MGNIFKKMKKKSKIDLKNKKCGSILNIIQTITGFFMLNRAINYGIIIIIKAIAIIISNGPKRCALRG